MHTVLHINIHGEQKMEQDENDETKVKGQLDTHAFISSCQRFTDDQTLVWPHGGEEEDSPLMKILRGHNRERSIQLFFHLLGGLTLSNKSLRMLKHIWWYLCALKSLTVYGTECMCQIKKEKRVDQRYNSNINNTDK